MADSPPAPPSPLTSAFPSSSSAFGGDDLDDQGDVDMTRELYSSPAPASPILPTIDAESPQGEESDGEGDGELSRYTHLGKRDRALDKSGGFAKRPRAAMHSPPQTDGNVGLSTGESAILAAIATFQETFRSHKTISERSLRKVYDRLEELQVSYGREMRDLRLELRNTNEELCQVKETLISLGLTSLVAVPKQTAPMPTTPLAPLGKDVAMRSATPGESAHSGDKYIGRAMREAGINTWVVGGQGRTVSFPFMSRPQKKKDLGVNFSDTEEDTMTDHPSSHGDTNFDSERDDSDLSSNSQPSPSQASDASSEATQRPVGRSTSISMMRSSELDPISPTPTSHQISSPLTADQEEEGESEIESDDPIDSVSVSMDVGGKGEQVRAKENRTLRGVSLVSEQNLRPSDRIQRQSWVWKPLGENSAKGRNWTLECCGCTGRVHWACAGFKDLTKWTARDKYYCPSCWPLSSKKFPHNKQQDIRQHAFVEIAQQETCLRSDCILHLDPIEDDDDQYTFEKVVGRRYRDMQDPETIEFLVKWAHWELWDCTWEPPSNLASFPDAIKKFERQAKAEGKNVGRRIFGERVILLDKVQDYFLPSTGKYNIDYLKNTLKVKRKAWWKEEEAKVIV
ncbi:hypothetical protein IAR50_001165 [Cryptococcus sp. DSM 104548]